jgi:preprotein translocase subunit SecF
VELFRDANFDFLGKKWYFLSVSILLTIAGLASMFFWHGIPLGVDFKGGTLVYVKFNSTPNEDNIRKAMDQAGLHNARIQRYGPPANNEVLIALEQKETSEASLDTAKVRIVQALEASVPQQQAAGAGKQDLNNASMASIREALMGADPLGVGIDAQQRYTEIAQAIVNYRDRTRGGVLASLDELKGVVPAPGITALQERFFVSNFAVRNVEIVGPQVGAQLQKQAILATLYSLAGMLVYLWFRFELMYGVAAVVAVFHDTLVTIGAFSLTNREITLTVIAAILTLIGYSMNDTIVIFDRVRENLKMMRRESFSEIVNRSINQTLSRTILTSGLTFLTVLSLYVFGGEVLRGFSFALVIGILIGTYSSVAVAAPILVAYQEWRARKSGRGPVAVPSELRREKVKA